MVTYQRTTHFLAAVHLHVPGGTLGFYCRHAYNHANENHNKRLPMALKGVDAMFYSVFHRLGLQVDLHAVMEGLRELLQTEMYGLQRDYNHTF